MMWQEARKQEKKIRGMLVDYKRRAERRKDYYERIKAEPTQFIQLHGRQCKIHLDPAVAIAGDSPANMMSWQGNQDILIDRFDVRAHLDYIPEIPAKKEEEELTQEDRSVNYERYRILAQNDFLGVSEDKFLHQLNIEEQFGPIEKTEPPPIEGKKKVVGAAIAYNYSEGASLEPQVPPEPSGKENKDSSDEDNDDEDDDDSDIDFDLCVDVNKISSAQAHEMNASALSYGMMSNDFFSFLTRDVEEAENLKIAREREEEKAMFSGRKSRRERRAFREKKLIGRKLSPPSYAAFKAAPIADLIRQVSKSRSRSRSRSASPPNTGVIEYITSFGSEEQTAASQPASVKASVHSSKEDGNMYKRTVRYRPSRSPESSHRRFRTSVESSRSTTNFRSHSIDKRRSPSRDCGRRSRSPNRRPRSPTTRLVRYRSRSRSPKRIVHLRSPVSSKSADKRRSTDISPSARSHHNNSKSKSPSPVQRIVKKSASPQPQRSIEVPAPPVITRYYGRRKNNSSSSELDLSDSEDKSDQTSDKQSLPDKSLPPVGNSGGRAKLAVTASGSKLSLQERLKKKRQALINRQYKADKRAERMRQEKAEQERQDREDEMREISIKMRRRERQKRHQYYDLDDSNHADNSDAEDRLSTASTVSSSEKLDTEHDGNRSRSHTSLKSKDRDGDRHRRSGERDRSREDSRRNLDSRRRRSRSGDRDRMSRRNRDEERPVSRRDGPTERARDRSRERSRERLRRDRDRSRDRYRDRSRERS